MFIFTLRELTRQDLYPDSKSFLARTRFMSYIKFLRKYFEIVLINVIVFTPESNHRIA